MGATFVMASVRVGLGVFAFCEPKMRFMALLYAWPSSRIRDGRGEVDQRPSGCRFAKVRETRVFGKSFLGQNFRDFFRGDPRNFLLTKTKTQSGNEV